MAANVRSVEDSYSVHFAVFDDGTVWAWGTDSAGQSGLGTKYSYVPAPVPGLSNVKAVAADGTHTVVLKNDGSVWACGKNDHGQIGDGTMTDRTTFVQMKGLSDIVAIDAADSVTLALKNDGTVWVCGYYKYGSGSDKNNVTTPEQVGGLANIGSVSAGNWHYLAVDKDGNAWGWGENLNGQLGLAAGRNQATPIKLSGLTGVKQAAAGYQYSLFLKNDGTVWALGWNNRGIQGTGQNSGNANTPVQVPGLSDIVQIEAATESATALKSDGTIYIWGFNNPGGWGIGKASASIYDPTALTYMTNAKQISGKSGRTLLALLNNGTVWGIGGTLFYAEPERPTYTVDPYKPAMIRFVAGVQQATPTSSAATSQPSAAPTQAPGSATKTPAPSALVVIAVLSAVAIFAMRKK